jgi:DNA-binding MarR family transcriptional regulator
VLTELKEERAVSLGALAERTHTDPSSVSVVVSRLAERGLVRRTASAEDARRAEIRLTRRGRALARRAPEASQTRLVGALSGLPEDARRGLADGLSALVAAMNLGGSPRMFFEDGPYKRAKRESPSRVHD